MKKRQWNTEQNRCKILSRPFQNQAFGGLEVLLGRLWFSWRGLGASRGLGADFLVNLAPRWGDDGAKLVQDVACVALLTFEFWRASWTLSWAILATS